MNQHEIYIQRCIQLALLANGNVAPNPVVGCVIIYDNKIIAEGYHKAYGQAHAEVNAINNVKDKSVLNKATLYVNLEPCSHHGKTPPCVDLIIKYKIPTVVIGCVDNNPLVGGKGISRLKEAGVNVIIDVLKEECITLNKRFFCFHNNKRPFIILKWAQTDDGFIGKENERVQITNHYSNVLVHKWRSEEAAIMVGVNTVITDNPQLNVRLYPGNNPVRIIIDLNNRIPTHYNVFDNTVKTIIFNKRINTKAAADNTKFIKVETEQLSPQQIVDYLYQENINSVMIEGGNKLLQSFINAYLWDEARVFTSTQILNEGIPAPILKNQLFIDKEMIMDNTLTTYLCSTK